MNEKMLLKISLAAAIFGLIFLFFYSEAVDLEQLKHVDDSISGQSVKIRGTITKLSAQEKVLFLDILTDQQETITAVLFTSEEVFIKVGDYVEIVGEIEEYNGEKEILSNSVRII